MSNEFSYKQLSFKFYIIYGLIGFFVYFFWYMNSYLYQLSRASESLGVVFNLFPLFICMGVVMATRDQNAEIKFKGNTGLYKLKIPTMLVTGYLGSMLALAINHTP